MFNQPVHRPGAGTRRHWWSVRAGTLSAIALIVLVSLLHPSSFNGAALHTSEAIAAPTHSTTIALTSDETRVVVVNREANSVSIIRVKDANGNDVSEKLFEIGVGEEPRCVAVHPNNQLAYVTNAISGTVSVVNVVLGTFVKEVRAGTEPRGCALTPDGSFLYVANHTEGTVSIIDTAFLLDLSLSPPSVQVGGNPTAIAIKDGGTGNISDDTVFVTQIFAELDPTFFDPVFLGNGEGRDVGKRGVIHAFPAGNASPPITKITLAPLPDSGFTANRVMPNNFCGAAAHSLIFCPNGDPNDPINTNNPQGVYPNQLLSAVIRGNLLYVTAIGPQPEPPEVFNGNVQALVYAVDTDANPPAEVAIGAKFKNLNVQIAVETAAPPPSLDKTFGNDIVAIDASLAPTPDPADNTFLIVSRGGNQMFRAKLANAATGELNILNEAGNRVDCRLQTGNLPSGVTMRKDGTRAYANNEANFSVTSVNIEDGVCLTQQLDISSSNLPAPGSFEHAVIVGKIAFFTALGIPDNDIFGTPIRAFIPRNFKGKQSKDAWSSCGSCHPDGLADGATWIFAAGDRQTIPLDGTFNKGTNMEDQRLLNWSAVRGSNTDFNQNSRAVQGGCGFASDNFDPGQCFAKGNATGANLAIYDHGITQGGSDALDAQTLWIFAAVRALNQPQPSTASDQAALQRGRDIFGANCASCHGGPKWTKSEIFHRDNPAAVSGGGTPTDPGVANLANEFKSFTCNTLTIKYLEDVGTFNAADPLEIRDNAAAAIALGADGFNVPSLLSINYHAPYLHNGKAQTLAEVFPLHGLGMPPNTIATVLGPAQQADLLVFLKAIDGTTPHFRSDGDVFRDMLRMAGPCP